MSNQNKSNVDAASRRSSQAGVEVMTPRTFQRNGLDVLSNGEKQASIAASGMPQSQKSEAASMRSSFA